MKLSKIKIKSMNDATANDCTVIHDLLICDAEAVIRRHERLLNGTRHEAEKEWLGWFSFLTHIDDAEVTVVAAKGTTLYLSGGAEISTEELHIWEALEALYKLTDALECMRRAAERKAANCGENS